MLAAAVAMLGIVCAVGVNWGLGLEQASRVIASAPVLSGLNQGMSRSPEAKLSVAASRGLLERIFLADSLDDVMPMVMDDGHTRRRMEEYSKRPGFVPGGEIISPAPRVTRASNRPVHWWRVRTADGIERLAGVFLDNGQPVLYWEHLVGYGDMSWGMFLDMMPKEAVRMRLVFRAPARVMPVINDQCWVDVSHPDVGISRLALVTDKVAARYLTEFFALGQEGTLATANIGYGISTTGVNIIEVRKVILSDWGENSLDLAR